MVLDTSAIIAAITNELDGARYRAAILSAESLLISAPAAFETKIVLQSRLAGGVALFDEMIGRAGIVVVPFDEEMVNAAFDAFRRFGKGQGHPAQLNIVDCAVYALAKTRSQPLLFKGGDFAKTDVAVAPV